jgi:holo-[acyl-carrier protein] synthase
MIIGTGIDIVNIDRIEGLMTRWGSLFLGRVFTGTEIVWCRQRARPQECFAIRFAAKEAFLKAIGWELRNGIQWTDIEVKNDSMGKPLLPFRRKAKEVCETPPNSQYPSHPFPRPSLRRGPCVLRGKKR